MLKYEYLQPQNSSWIELDRKSYQNNIAIYKNLIGENVQLGCVLKGNAYGHGFFEMLQLVYETPIDIIFVINPNDALFIRKFESDMPQITKKRIIVLGATMPNEVSACSENEIEVAFGEEHFSNQHYFHLLCANQKKHKKFNPLKIHLHIDTGLGREGIRPERLKHILEVYKKNKDIIFIQGIMSHFANTEDVTEQQYAYVQLDALESSYKYIVNGLQLKHKPEKHISQSAATLIMPEYRYDIIRVGIALYGLWPSTETKISMRVLMPSLPQLTPVLSWRTKSQLIHELPEGSYVGYGCSYRADRDLKIAVLPVGYCDGYPRALSNLGHVLVNGKRCKILGRVMMNHCVVDITEIHNQDEFVIATLIGHDGNEFISAEMLADWDETINYEIVTRIGAHLKRLVIQ